MDNTTLALKFEEEMKALGLSSEYIQTIINSGLNLSSIFENIPRIDKDSKEMRSAEEVFDDFCGKVYSTYHESLRIETILNDTLKTAEISEETIKNFDIKKMSISLAITDIDPQFFAEKLKELINKISMLSETELKNKVADSYEKIYKKTIDIAEGFSIKDFLFEFT